MNVSQPNQAQRPRCRTCRGDQKTLVKRTQVETPINAVAEGSQVARRIFLEVEGMEATRQTGLEITEHGVDPLELGNLPRFTSSHDCRAMHAAGLGDRSEAGQAIGEHRTSRGQLLLGPNSPAARIGATLGGPARTALTGADLAVTASGATDALGVASTGATASFGSTGSASAPFANFSSAAGSTGGFDAWGTLKRLIMMSLPVAAQ